LSRAFQAERKTAAGGLIMIYHSSLWAEQQTKESPRYGGGCSTNFCLAFL